MTKQALRVLAVAVFGLIAGCSSDRAPDERTGSAQSALAGSGLRLLYHHGEDWSASNNEIKPHFKIVNEGSAAIPLSELTIRYWYSREGTASESSNCYWAQVGCGNILRSNTALATPSQGATHSFDVGFTGGAGQLPAGANTGEMKLQFHKSDWSPYDENNDLSYDPARTTWGDATNVALYRNGVLVWGKEPGGASAPSCTDGTQNGDETDIDCGGSCPGCPNGLSCTTQ